MDGGGGVVAMIDVGVNEKGVNAPSATRPFSYILFGKAIFSGVTTNSDPMRV